MRDRDRVLREIFFPTHSATGRPEHEIDLAPTFDELGDFAELLAKATPEEEVQRFLTAHPSFLAATFGFADSSTLAFITKPRVGRLVADFALMTADQGPGFAIHLIEIEPPSEPLFTRALTPARRYQTAIGQVLDWRQWVQVNRQTFTREMLALAKQANQLPARDTNGSFRTTTADRLDHLVRMYAGGDDGAAVSYTIIIGRWANLDESQRDRLITLNRTNPGYTTYTFDQVARKAFKRPLTDWDIVEPAAAE